MYDDGGPAGGSHSHEHPHAGGGGGGRGSAAGSGAVAGAPCVPELGREPVEHACSHTMLGPFVEVAALSPGRANPANVSELQTAFNVDVVDAGARLLYVAARDGDHVLLTDRTVELVVRDERMVAILGVPLPVTGCGTIATGLVVELRQDSAYIVEIPSTDVRTFTLFVEHLGTFGDAAWSQKCPE